MPLSVGTRLGPYEILAPLGAGGMGEVYRARDLARDGKRFVVLMPAESPEPRETQNHVTLVVNFLDEVRRRIAAQGR